MEVLRQFRDEAKAKSLIDNIKALATKPVSIMEVCGGQTHTILKYGIEDLLPENIRLLHGPGCPVCVTSLEAIDMAINISLNKDVIFCTYGDMLRVPGSSMDLFKAKACGANLKIVYSPLDALKVALANPQKNIVFFAIGFETTAPANAMLILQAKKLNLKNFFVLCHEVLVPPIIASLLEAKESSIQAFLGPGHVCSVMGLHEYENLVHNYQLPIVVTGFEPLDILEGIYACVQQLNNNEVRLENQYTRAVTLEGNLPAQQAMKDVFEICDRKWRGLGFIPKSGLCLNSQFKDFDATIKFNVDNLDVQESKECISGEILRGLKKPYECEFFGTKCTPLNPLGATMVSSEGACSAYYKYRQSKLTAIS